MLHEMKLQQKPFNSIKAGQKTIEMRLNDEKRRLINIGDEIEFTCVVSGEKLQVSVCGLVQFDSFDTLYNTFNKRVLGYNDNEVANPTDMSKYYSIDEQKEYGVLAIVIKLI